MQHLVDEKILRIVPGKLSRKGQIKETDIPSQTLDGLDWKSKLWLALISTAVAAGISLFYALYLEA